MALVIQSFAAQARGNHLGSREGAPLTGAVPRVDLAQRDKQGVYALSLVAEGESRLQAFLRQAEEQGGISGREEAFFTSAQEEMRKIVEKSQGEETGKVVARQLQGSLEAFRIRSQDLAIREHLSHCETQIRQRRNDVAATVAGLAETARSAPAPELREKALYAVHSQVAALRQAEKAMACAQGRYMGGVPSTPESASAEKIPLGHPAGMVTKNGETQ